MSSSTEVRPVLPDLAAPARSTGVTGLRMPELGAVEATRDAARAQGYATGWAEGRREAETSAREDAERLAADHARREAVRDAEVAAAVTALREAADALHRTVAATCVRVDEQASALALELTRTLTGRVEPDPAHVVARVVGLLPEHPLVSVRLHPTVAALAGDLAGDLAAHGVAVVPDPTLRPADAVAHADDHVVDLRVDEALARLEEALR